MINAAFTGGGLSSVTGLGAYSVVCSRMEFNSFSGASIGSVIAASLAGGKTPSEVRDFLAENIVGFCAPIKGNFRIEKKVNEFLGNMLYRDLERECRVSITPLRWNFPRIITRENSEDMTVGEVVAMSSALPGLFLPRLAKLEKKRAIVLDGGIILNPPLAPSENVLFSFVREDKADSKAFWNCKKRALEAQADILIRITTYSGTLGKPEDVYKVFEEGRNGAPIIELNS